MTVAEHIEFIRLKHERVKILLQLVVGILAGITTAVLIYSDAVFPKDIPTINGIPIVDKYSSFFLGLYLLFLAFIIFNLWMTKIEDELRKGKEENKKANN